MTEPRALIDSYFACVNAEDWNRMRTIWHPDGEFKAVGARQRNGIDEVVGYFERLFDPWTEHRDIPQRVLMSGETAAVEVRFEGTTAAGVTVAFDAVDVFDFEDGMIRRISNWYDLVYAREMLAA